MHQPVVVSVLKPHRCLTNQLARIRQRDPTDAPDVDFDGPLVFFAGHQQSRYFDHSDGVDSRMQRAGALALASVADGSADGFIDVYRQFELGPRPTVNADAKTRAACAREYFDQKLFFAAARNLGTRDRFVLALTRRLGDRFHFVGDDRWHAMYGIEPGHRLDDDAYAESIRRTPL